MRSRTALLAGFIALSFSQAAFAEPTVADWEKWSARANQISAMIENFSDEHSYRSQIHAACDGTSAMFLGGSYPRWAAMIQPICAVLYSPMGGNYRHGCHKLPGFTRELAKGEPVQEVPSVELARLRLLAATDAICARH